MDANGRGFAQTDLLLFPTDTVVLVELKLSYYEEAWNQLDVLYGPLCQEIWPDRRQVRGLVCRNMGGPVEGALQGGPAIREYIETTTGPSRFLAHWIGV